MTLDVWADGSDSRTVVGIKPRTVLQWERENGNRSAIQLNDDAVRITYLYELAWIAVGKPGGDFTAWSAATDVTLAQDDDPEQEAAGPTSVAASIAP
jgi:hypothetical protein